MNKYLNGLPLNYIKQSVTLNRNQIFGSINNTYGAIKKNSNIVKPQPIIKPITTSIIFLHGLFGSGDNFRLCNKLLIEKFKRSSALDYIPPTKQQQKNINQEIKDINNNIDINLYSLDIRNHGLSPHSTEMTLESIESDIYLFLKDSGIIEKKLNEPESNKIILVGHSMGAKSSIMFALNNPHLIDGLIPIDASPTDYNGTHNHNIKFQAMLNASNLFTNKETTKNQIESKLQQSGILDKGERLYLLNNLIDKSVSVNNQFSWKLNVETLFKNQSNLLTFPDINKFKQFKKKVLFIGGADSHYLQYRFRKNIHKLLPNHEIQMIQNTTHFVHAQRPQHFCDIIHTYLKNIIIK